MPYLQTFPSLSFSLRCAIPVEWWVPVRDMPYPQTFPSLSFGLRCAIPSEWWWMTVCYKNYIVPALLHENYALTRPSRKEKEPEGTKEKKRK